MPEKEWVAEFNAENRLRVHFVTQRGRGRYIWIVQYEALIGGKWVALVRFDAAHGYFHRDILRPDGTREKLRLSPIDLGQALTEAIEELKQQWPFYRQLYEEGAADE
jgi:hypothetical protein